jgi:lipid-A-disaccharide synthase
VRPDSAVRRVLIVAGEPSGDQAAAPVVAALARLRPQWRIEAVGGPLLAAAGAEIILPYDELAVMGFAEVLARLPALRSQLRRLTARLDAGQVDLLLPVDFPGFNLRLAAQARRRRLPVLYFVAPQVWAWGERRIRQLARNTDALAVILPFEEAWFAERGLRARFVGHPIMEQERPLAVLDEPPRLGLLPGSRAQEVRRHLPVMLAAAGRLAARRPALRCALLESPALAEAAYDALLAASPLPIQRCREDSAGFLARQSLALVASGTATLEAAVAGLPMAVIYRTGALNYWLARRLISLDRIALVNLVAGETLVPEFIQEAADPEILADALDGLAQEGPARQRQREGLAAVRAALGGPGCGERVAAMAIELLERA